MVNITFLSNGGKVASAPENSNLLRVSQIGRAHV